MKKNKIRTPEEFYKDVERVIADDANDVESLHCNTDTLMENLLIALGYKKAVKAIRATNRFYA